MEWEENFQKNWRLCGEAKSGSLEPLAHRKIVTRRNEGRRLKQRDKTSLRYKEAIEKIWVKNGKVTVSFHQCIREGDRVIDRY